MQLESGMSGGRLRNSADLPPDLRLREAQDLIAELRTGRSQRKPRPQIKVRLARFAEFVRNTLPKWSASERKLVHAELLRLADEVAPGHRLQVMEAGADSEPERCEAGTDLRQSRTNFL